MTSKMRVWVLFSLIFLPLAAFADLSSFTSALTFFQPPQGDYSISLLERTFGTIGNVLSGRGNQIIGIVLGVFNACWVVLIGLGILFIMWDAVINAAHSGDMMGGRGKKTVFMIIRVCIGFSLVVPSNSTGYSLAQNIVMWVVVQGVGLADKVNNEVYDYLKVGGSVFTQKPSTGNEINTLMPAASQVLASEICMYKLQAITQQQAQKDKDIIDNIEDGTGIVNPPTDQGAIGYSVNANPNSLSGSITFGSLNKDYNPNNPSSKRYNDECGSISWMPASIDFGLSLSETQKLRKALSAYMQAGSTEMVLNLLPVAREVAAVNPNSSKASENYTALSENGSNIMAGSGISYATLVDPTRRAAGMANFEDMKAQIERLHQKGWFFTPIMMMSSGLNNIPQQSVELYAPTTAEAKLDEPTGVLKTISSESLDEIKTAVGRITIDDYASKAKVYLDKYDQNNAWSGLNLGNTGIYNPADPNTGTGTDKILEGAADVMSWGIGTMGNLVGGGMSIIGGTLKGIDAISMGAIPGMGSMIGTIDYAESYIKDESKSAAKGLSDAMYSFTSGTYRQLAVKGGLSGQIVSLSNQVGPIGYLFTVISTALIGESLDVMERNLFQSDVNALAGVVGMGRDFMRNSIESLFKVGNFVMWWSTVSFGLKAMSSIPYLGAAAGFLGGKIGEAAAPLIIGFAMFHISLSMIILGCGLLLYLIIPLTYILTFAAVCLRWIGMVFLNVMAAPVFCFNLIRTDSDGLIGKGEAFLTDLVKTALTPAVLAIGAVVFLLLFNIGYMVISAIFGEFLSALVQINHSYIIPIVIAAMLMIFALAMMHITTILSNLCTVEFVNSVGQAVGHGFQQLHEQTPHHELRHVGQGVGGQAGQTMQGPALNKGMPGGGQQGGAGGQQSQPQPEKPRPRRKGKG
ncbi:MAG: DotA/TraY family protein [Gammaproteobacteria bacterium]